MALKSCKECGKGVSTKADSCPHCGALIKAKNIGCFTSFFIIFLFIFMIGLLVGENKTGLNNPTSELTKPSKPINGEREAALRDALGYLNDIKEISWVDIEGNDIYIGWESFPADFAMINKAAAMIGNRAINFGTHVWSIRAKQKGWRPGVGPYVCETTARGGKIKESSCKAFGFIK